MTGEVVRGVQGDGHAWFARKKLFIFCIGAGPGRG